ncbi:MAG: FMN-binding protein [Clostridia bacterium]|nr:FMN-binding protein [Clostridia bacterium]
MPLSIIFAWIAVICSLITVFRFAVKKNRLLNRIFHKTHKQIGILMILAGLIHGIFAGNSIKSTMSDAFIGDMLFTLNAGTICFVISVLLLFTYMLRKLLKKNWMMLHRILTVALVAVLAFHIFQMGITLPRVITYLADTPGGEEVATEESPDMIVQPEEPETKPEPTPTPEPSATPKPEESSTENADLFTLPLNEESEMSEEAAAEEINETEPEEVSEESSENEPEEAEEPAVSASFSGAVLADGSYYGSADGYKSTISVCVTVDGGWVSDISVTEEYETPKYFGRATDIIWSIINRQTLEVDGVTGATYSSKGIQQAVYNALQDAVISGELNISEIETW